MQYNVFNDKSNNYNYNQLNIFRALQLPPEAWLRMTINHASITIISVGMTGRTALKGYNDIGFMPVDLITDKFYY